MLECTRTKGKDVTGFREVHYSAEERISFLAKALSRACSTFPSSFLRPLSFSFFSML